MYVDQPNGTITDQSGQVVGTWTTLSAETLTRIFTMYKTQPTPSPVVKFPPPRRK